MNSEDNGDGDYFKQVHYGIKQDHIRIVKSLLKFNPNERMSIDHILNMPLFKDVRQASSEILNQKQIKISIDQVNVDGESG